MTTTQSRIAVFGCGSWGQNLVRIFYQLGVLHLVCDPAESARSRARTIAPGVEIIPNWQTALKRPDLDAIVLTTPAETHYPLALQALAAGKHLLVEKPLALNYTEGLELETAANQAQRLLMVGHLLEYHPAVLTLRRLIAEQFLGNVNYIYSHRLNFGKVRTGESALWSFAPHDFAVILRLFGALPIEVTCVGGSYITPNLPDVTVSCLHFASGQRAHVFVSWLHPFKEQRLVLVGDRRMAVFNDMAKTDKLVLFDQRVDLQNRQPILQHGGAQMIELPDEEPLRNECLHFLECLARRTQPLTNGKSALQVLKVLQACQISLRLNGSPIQLSQI